MPVRAVIFDWGGTLTPWHAVEARDAWLAAAAADAELADRLAAAEDALWQRTMAEQRSATLAELFAMAEVEHSAEAIEAFHRWWEPHTYLDPAAPELFDALRRRGIRIGVLSNTIWPREVHERIFERDGVLDRIDGAVYSSEIAWTKPHREAFLAALRAVGVDEPTEAVYVGDRLYDDIHGAQSVGMRAVYVPHSDIPDRQRGPVDGTPDAVIHDLGDLLDVIDDWSR